MKEIIGSNTFIDVLGYQNIPAKIDTGADSSAICVSDVYVSPDNFLHFKLFSPKHPFYDGKDFSRRDFKVVVTRSSHGEEKIFYRTHLSINIQGHKIKALFTLSDRSNNNFPVLIGRRTIKNRFIVDVSKSPVDTPPKNSKNFGLNHEMQKNPYLFHQKYIVKKKGKIS